MTCTTPSQRFLEARERLQLSVEEAAQLCGISAACVRDLESYPDELTSCYSAVDLVRFSKVLQISPSAFFGDEVTEPAVSPSELEDRIRDECSARKITLEQFEDVVGWKLGESMTPPERLLEEMTLDGLQWLCRELRIDWRRVIAAL